jgi:3-hydroxyisobutyrate dehydrogenase
MSVAATKLSVAFLGLGVMGGGMARRLAEAGIPLAVFNRDRAKTKPLSSVGARVAETPRQAAAAASVVISMLADDHASRAIWLGPEGALAGAAKGSVCIESSTVTLDWVRELAAAAAERGCQFLDAPVTGSKVHAASGELTFLVGGPSETLEKVRPVLAIMSKALVPAGPVGSGAMIKLINNFVCGVQVASLAEALVMIERSGLERARVLEVLTNGAPGSPLVKLVAARMTAGDYTPNFALRLMAKDLGYAIREAEKLGLELQTAASALARFRQGQSAGLSDKDMAAVIDVLKRERG